MYRNITRKFTKQELDQTVKQLSRADGANTTTTTTTTTTKQCAIEENETDHNPDLNNKSQQFSYDKRRLLRKNKTYILTASNRARTHTHTNCSDFKATIGTRECVFFFETRGFHSYCTDVRFTLARRINTHTHTHRRARRIRPKIVPVFKLLKC